MLLPVGQLVTRQSLMLPFHFLCGYISFSPKEKSFTEGRDF